MTAPSARGADARRLRIIAGRWKGRRFRFPPLPASAGLRPTPDRVRETLFNWLQPRIVGAHCLDLYAGSGALGLEALSRGAASVLFVESQRVAADALSRLLREWDVQGARLIEGQALRLLGRGPAALAPSGGFDQVFVDPPFDAPEQLPEALAALARGWLAADARVYVEHRRGVPLPPLPGGWTTLRSGCAGEVEYHLLAATPARASPGGGQP